MKPLSSLTKPALQKSDSLMATFQSALLNACSKLIAYSKVPYNTFAGYNGLRPGEGRAFENHQTKSSTNADRSTTV